MKHILFFDEDTTALGQLQSALSPAGDGWKLEFESHADRAKLVLQAADVDVLFTELATPDGPGAEVLELTREYSPKTIRLVLTGQMDAQVALKCVGLAHQCLAKPCDVVALRGIVTRVSEIGFATRDERVMTLVAKLKHLPSLPTIYLQLVRLMTRNEASMEEVGALIMSDMAMTAKVLQLVNSSFFGLARNVSNPAEAAGYLGLETLKALVLAAGVFAQYEKRTSRDFSASLAARHSQQVGAAAKAIAATARSKANPGLVDQALVAGMLHDIGKLVLATNLPDDYQRALTDRHAGPLAAERAIFGANHAEIGGYLLGLWGLPPAVVEAIRLHHAPAEAGDTELSALTAVHVANCLVGELNTTMPAARRSALDIEYLAALGVADRLPEWREVVKKVTG